MSKYPIKDRTSHNDKFEAQKNEFELIVDGKKLKGEKIKKLLKSK